MVLSVSDMIRGRYGDITNPSYLDVCLNQSTGVRFKIDNIIINREYYRNYHLDDSEINEFEFVRELTDEEFYPIELLIESNYKFPDCVIDIERNDDDIYELVNLLRNKKEQLESLKREIGNLERNLYWEMRQI